MSCPRACNKGVLWKTYKLGNKLFRYIWHGHNRCIMISNTSKFIVKYKLLDLFQKSIKIQWQMSYLRLSKMDGKLVWIQLLFRTSNFLCHRYISQQIELLHIDSEKTHLRSTYFPSPWQSHKFSLFVRWRNCLATQHFCILWIIWN